MSKRRSVGWKTKKLGDMSGTYETDGGEAKLKGTIRIYAIWEMIST